MNARPRLIPILSPAIWLPLILLQLGFDDKPLHERLTAAAWDALKQDKHAEAIAQSDKCIEEFVRQAKRDQEKLANQKIAVPQGRVNEKLKLEIQKNGVLNDVATCMFIKARAADKLGQRDVAVKTCADVRSFPSARAWDSRGWFWSPAEAAERWLKNPELVDKAPHEIYTADAWTALNRGAYDQAIVHASKCIEEFQESATELQKELAKKKPQLPTGAVRDDVKAKIFENGVLNDVATCLFIKGRALESKGERRPAAQVYHEATKLTFGRCWDPQGWFWSPAEGSSDRLEILR